MLKEKFEALKDYLIESGEATEEELQEVTAGQSYNSDFDYFELLGCEYLVLTDGEADEKTAEYIKDSLWAFNADFILKHTAVYEETTDREDAEIIKALCMVQGSICESANVLVKALIVDIDDFIRDAIDADGRGNTYIGKMDLETTDGSRTRYEYEPYNTFYGYEVKSGNVADFIDKSGYLLRPRRFELMQKAERLRKERKQTEANNADFTEATTELQGLIDKARGILSGSVMACSDADTANKLSDKMRTFARVLSYFADYTDKLNAKKYASIDRIKADIDLMKEKLNYCIN